MPKRAFTLIELMIVMAIIAVIAVLAVPNLIQARKNGNEAAAIGGLKSIMATQPLFQQGDKDANGLIDFGNLQQLSNLALLDPVLAGGVKQGYNFNTDKSATTPEFMWFATANPVAPGQSGDRYFCTSYRGQILFTNLFSIGMNTADCEAPVGVLQIR